MKERDLKVGDRVKVMKNEDCPFIWVKEMDNFVGEIFLIENIAQVLNPKGEVLRYTLCSIGDSEMDSVGNYSFSKNSLELLEEQGCRHTDLMLKYVKDCQKCKKPWVLWQYYDENEDKWKDFPEGYGHLMWNETSDYRRKPSTININGFEVPEPLREAPEDGTMIYRVDFYSDEQYGYAYFHMSNSSPVLKKNVTYGTNAPNKRSSNFTFQSPTLLYRGS
jgi:hypothetical protein